MTKVVTDQDILQILFATIDELNLQRPTSEQIRKDPETVLSGPNGTLSSLELVNLVVGAEERLEDAFGVMLNPADEKTAERPDSPFQTVVTLLQYIKFL